MGSRRRERDFREWAALRLPALLRTGYLLTSSADAAQDLVQEALTRTYGRLGTLGDARVMEAYTRRCMTSIVTDEARRSALFRRNAHLLDASAPDVALDRIGDRDLLRNVLRMLSPLQRACVVLRFYEDLSVAETAEQLGCSTGTVKRETHDALGRARISSMLRGEPGGEESR